VLNVVNVALVATKEIESGVKYWYEHKNLVSWRT